MGEKVGFLVGLLPISWLIALALNFFMIYSINIQTYDVKESVVDILEQEGGLTNVAQNRIDQLLSNYGYEINVEVDKEGQQPYGTVINVNVTSTFDQINFSTTQNGSAKTSVIWTK